jgi:hypothetical protein
MLAPPLRILLRAATRGDAAGREAFAAWRRTVRLDDIDAVAHRAMPFILEHGARGISVASGRQAA